MRLFTALWPADGVAAALRGAVPDLGAGWRPTPPELWHVTLAFHGDDDPDRRRRELDERVRGAAAPRLRIAGTGTFPGVLWAGVEPASDGDGDALRTLVAGAGGDPNGFVAHLTLARSRRRGRAGPPPDLAPGPWWTPRDVLLVASERADGEPRYRTVHRVPLAA